MDRVDKRTRSRIMSAIRSKDTTPERAMAESLSENGMDGFTLNDRTLPGTPDIAFRARRLAVFIDGCFWHGCPKHYRRPKTNKRYWDGKLSSSVERDARNDTVLEAGGWKSLRIWECEVMKDADRQAKRIIEELGKGVAPNEN